MIEAQGIVAEVIFPNTVPPFFPHSVISAAGPATREEYERRWAGVQAHNRWLTDFCALVPGKRLGIAQLFVYDVDDAVAEVKFAHANGLKGVLLPANHFHGLVHWFLPKYDPLWRICEELEMPVHCHGVIPSDPVGPETGDASAAIGAFEASTLGHRPLHHFLLSGVFERFPGLKLVMTELLAAWIPPLLQSLDGFCDAARDPNQILFTFANDLVKKMPRKPSEYFSTNCYAATFFTEADKPAYAALGTDRLMWGADFPHHEGVVPYVNEALRASFAGLSEADIRKMTSLNAVDLYGLDLDEIQAVGDRIGPRPAEIGQPLTAAEWPADCMGMTFSMSPMPAG